MHVKPQPSHPALSDACRAPALTHCCRSPYLGPLQWLLSHVHAGHMAQLCYKDSMKEVPDGFLSGLKEVVRYVRCGDNWKKLVEHMSRFAGEEGAAFQNSLLHALLADEIDWAGEVSADPDLIKHLKDRRKGYKVPLPTCACYACFPASLQLPCLHGPS